LAGHGDNRRNPVQPELSCIAPSGLSALAGRMAAGARRGTRPG